MDLIPYETSGGCSPLQEYMESLDEKSRKKVVWAIDRLEREGFNLLRISDIFSKVDGWDDLHELKIPYRKIEHRIMCGKWQSDIYLLDAFAKKEQKLKRADIQRSEARLKELKTRANDT